ncbi:MAG: cyclic nucleotide-binding domain-containing protein [Chthoniobacterales bacterium]
MPENDFFGFCTTLKVLELKAIGELSHVRHLSEGETVYSTGDPGDALYIINRGTVEVVQPSGRKSGAAYLSRGDVFGDVEALSNLARKHVVRACEPVSLQCFARKDFPEVARRVPSFFLYLSGQLASRLSHASDLAMTQSHCLELSGNLANFDLVTVYQTISNSSQSGQLRISNSNGELISALFFEKGQPRFGQFEHLTGEEAFWQLFVTEDLPGTFSFSTGELPTPDWIQSERITKSAGEMLINALQGRDEFAELKRRFAENGDRLEKCKGSLTWPTNAPPESKAVAEQIWQLAAKGPVTVAGLFHKCMVCEFKVYQVVEELIRSRHLTWSGSALAAKVA